MSIAIVAGIRSHYTKLSLLNSAAEALDVRSEFLYIDAAQHYSKELSQNFITDLGIDFQHSFRSLDLPLDATRRISAIEFAFLDLFRNRADIEGVVVLGDANTTLVAARSARACGKHVIHVEAGTRTQSNSQEERNRRLTDEISNVCLTSSRTCLNNLRLEGLATRSLFIGDILIDGCMNALAQEAAPSIDILVTLHHDEAWPDNFIEDIYQMLGELRVSAILLLHPKDQLKLSSSTTYHERIAILSYIEHPRLLQIIRSAKVVLTDSGSVQREAHYLGRRAIVVQQYPFWPNLIREGLNVAVAPNLEEIRTAVNMAPSELERVALLAEEFGSPPIGTKLIRAILDSAK